MLQGLAAVHLERICSFLVPEDIIALNQVDTNSHLDTAELTAETIRVLIEAYWQDIRDSHLSELEDQFASTFLVQDPYLYESED